MYFHSFLYNKNVMFYFIFIINNLILNFGPQHPSARGVFSFLLYFITRRVLIYIISVLVIYLTNSLIILFKDPNYLDLFLFTLGKTLLLSFIVVILSSFFTSEEESISSFVQEKKNSSIDSEENLAEVICQSDKVLFLLTQQDSRFESFNFILSDYRQRLMDLHKSGKMSSLQVNVELGSLKDTLNDYKYTSLEVTDLTSKAVIIRNFLSGCRSKRDLPDTLLYDLEGILQRTQYLDNKLDNLLPTLLSELKKGIVHTEFGGIILPQEAVVPEGYYSSQVICMLDKDPYFSVATTPEKLILLEQNELPALYRYGVTETYPWEFPSIPFE